MTKAESAPDPLPQDGAGTRGAVSGAPVSASTVGSAPSPALREPSPAGHDWRSLPIITQYPISKPSQGHR